MRLLSRPSSLPRPHGGAVRVLIVLLGCGALAWLGWIALLPPQLQQREFLTFLGAAALCGVVLLLLWLARPRQRAAAAFWLCADGQGEASGPYTVAQIVAMWRAGQITTRGLVAEEGTERWVPIRSFASEFDASMQPQSGSGGGFIRLLAIAVMVLVVLAVAFGPRQPQSLRAPVPGETLGEQLRNFETSARGQEIKAQAIQEWQDEQTAKAELDAQVSKALELALPPSKLSQ